MLADYIRKVLIDQLIWAILFLCVWQSCARATDIRVSALERRVTVAEIRCVGSDTSEVP